MGFVAAVGADEESAAVVQPGEGAFDNPTLTPEPGAVFGLASRDYRLDAAFSAQAPEANVAKLRTAENGWARAAARI